MHDWIQIKGYPLDICNCGLVRCSKTNRIKKASTDTSGYLQISYAKTTVKHHKLMAIAFIPNPDNKPQINHKDGNKQNNTLANLEWVTQSENQIHAYQILNNGGGTISGHGMNYNKWKGVTKNGRYGYMSRIVVNNKRIYLGTYKTTREAAEAYNKAALQYHTKPKLNKL